MAGFTPTAEQEQVIDLFSTERDVAVQALAGTGKTSTIELLARSTPRRGRYLVFNKAASNDAAARMPLSMECSTIHSLAFRAYGHRFSHRLGGGRVQSWRLAQLMGIDPFMVTVDDRNKLLQPSMLASWTIRALKVFCQSGDDEPSWRHFPYLEGIDDHPEPGVKGYRNNRALAKALEPKLAEAWEDWQSPGGKLPYDHSAYLAGYVLGDPRVPVDYIAADEFQDQSGRMLQLVAYNQARGVQLVATGDVQQHLYGFTGAVDGFERLDFAATGWLTGSFRFGQGLADVANLALRKLGSQAMLQGLAAHDSTVGEVEDPRAVLCRTNSGAVEQVLKLRKRGLRPHLVGGAAEVVRFAKAVADLQEGRKTYHPELACFDSWAQVIEYTEQDPSGDELKLMVDLVREYGVQIICDALDGLPAEEYADVIVSTVHKSKGREWETVRLAGDFQEPSPGPEGAPEWRVGYVACTRAKRVLDPRACGPVQALIGGAA
jgi:hypothetical protein